MRRLTRGGITGFVIRRLLLGIVTLGLVSVIVFAATQALPGDPARAILGRSATAANLEALRDQLGLHRSLPQQYGDWLAGLLRGDLGRSLAANQPVTTLLGDRIINSAFLVLCSALVSIPLSVLLGAYAALRRDRRFDRVTAVVLLALAALPEFVVGLALVLLFGTTVFQVLPATAYVAPGSRPWDDPAAIVLPTLTLVLVVTPYIARMMRSSMVEVLESDYVEMARLKGLSSRVVLWRHALPNALGPTLQAVALVLAYLAGGVIVVEYLFAYDGVGSALRDAVANHDLPVVQALAMLIAGWYVVANLLADVATVAVTPRLRSRL